MRYMVAGSLSHSLVEERVQEHVGRGVAATGAEALAMVAGRGGAATVAEATEAARVTEVVAMVAWHMWRRERLLPMRPQPRQ
jgi:hypothetical protein